MHWSIAGHRRVQRWVRRLSLVAPLAFVLLLVGCGVIENHVTLYEGEEWEAEIQLSLTPVDLSMVGGAGVIEADLQKQAAQLEKQEIQFEWHREQHDDGSTTYCVSMEGKGLDQLNTAVFDDQATIDVESAQGKRLIHFTYSPSALEARSYTLSLTGGEIVSSNADRVEKNTAIWYNLTGQAEARLTEASKGLGAIPCLGSFLGSIVILGIAGLVVRRQH